MLATGTAISPEGARAAASGAGTRSTIDVDDTEDGHRPGTALIATAFAVGRGDVWVTARHTALDCRERYIVVTGPGGFATGVQRVPAEMVALSDRADLALLTTGRYRATYGGLPFATVAPAAARLDDGSIVAMARDEATGELQGATLDLTDRSVRIHMRTTLAAAFTGLFLTASADQPHNPRPGSSGAPLMDWSGRVVGSVVGGMTDPAARSHFTLAVPGETLVGFLEQNRVALQAASPAQPTAPRMEAAIRPMLCVR